MKNPLMVTFNKRVIVSMNDTTDNYERNNEGTERGHCWECGFMLDKSFSFNKVDTRNIKCPKCGVETYQGAWYPREFAKAKAEYEASK